MVLGTLMKFVGRHFIIQRRVFWLPKTYLDSMLDESCFGAATEMGGFALDKGPELSLAPEHFGTSIFTSSASVGGADKNMYKIILSLLVP